MWPGDREGGAMERPGRMDQRLGPYGGDVGLGEGWSEIFCLFPFADRTIAAPKALAGRTETDRLKLDKFRNLEEM